MNRALLLAFVATLVVSTFAEDDVIKGTKANFDEIIGKDELTLVKFFAPWCGHCKSMAADFKEAATELKGKATLVDLDATVEKEVAEKYNIRGFPTLKLFSKGEVISDYKGGRTKDALIKYIERALLPSIEECTDAAAVSATVEKNKGKAIVFGVKLDKLSEEFKKSSMSLRDMMPDTIAFASVAEVAHMKDVGGDDVKEDTIVLVRDDGSKTTFSEKPEALENWVKISSLPAFAELSRDNAGVYTELDTPIFMLFQDPEKKDKAVNDVVAEVAAENRGNSGIAFTWINSVELGSFAEHVGCADKKPAIAIYEFKSDTKYVFDEDFDKNNLSAWVERVLAGEVGATTKSEPVPEKNDEPVKVVVGNSWEDIVEDTGKDVLIEQYAPWCGHCKKLAPILDDLASKLSGVKTLTIAKMDATKNDAPKDYKAQGYPTLHFFPAGDVQKGVSYDGGRTLEDFVKYLKENATHKEGIEIEESDTKEEEKDGETAEDVKQEL